MCDIIEEFTCDIGMEMGLSKCGVIHIQKGKYANLGSITLKSGGVIQELGNEEVYKYLGIEELVGISHDKVKEKVWKKAKAKLRKLLETELSSKNLFLAINECILPIISYSFGVVNWLEAELKQLDVNIRKMLHMYKAMHIKNDVDRLYGPRVGGGRGLISVWDSFKADIVRISHVMEHSSCEVLTACYNLDQEKLHSNIKRAQKYECETPIEYPKGFFDKSTLHQAKVKSALLKKKLLERRLKDWQEKPQHGAFARQLTQVGAAIKESFGWMNGCFLDPFSEAYVMAAQEMALFTKYHERNILHVSNDATCRVCKKNGCDETIYHILAGCDSLAKKEYFARHNAVCKYLHFEISKAYNLPCGKNWYLHEPKDIIVDKKVDILYDQVLQTDLEVGANRPDIVIKDKLAKKTYLIDVSCPCDLNIHKAEATKVAKYRGLRGQLQKLWGFECLTVPIIIGGLGTITSCLKDYLALLPGDAKPTMCQKITLFGSKKILIDVLSRKR